MLSFFVGACSSSNNITTNPSLQATLWVQNSVEFDALAIMAYQTAGFKLDEALADKNWSASVEQESMDVSELPPAIILDIDETVLDNSPFQARMIAQNSEYNSSAWEKWVLEANADAIAGAVDFTNKAAKKGITVIYLSNREANTEEETRQNLIAEGFPISKETDVVLLKGEQENWTSAKIERRKKVASSYRIIMLFGDDFNDFLPAKNISEMQRDALLKQYKNNIGTKWFVLPNPIYGSWNDAMFNFDRSLTDEQKLEALEKHLHPKM